MRTLVAVVVIVHGLLHLMGFAKAFGLAELAQLTQPISRPLGVVWLLASLLVLGSAVTLFAWPRGFWMIGVLAAVVSQVAIATSWHDAKAGTLANVVLALAAIHGFLTEGPWSFRADFERSARARTETSSGTRPVSDADLVGLPEPVRRYLHATGVVGQERPRNYRLRFRGRMRTDSDARWMPFVADQQSVVDTRERLFLMRATLFGIPIEAYHRLVGGRASMRVVALGAIPVADARGDEMDRSETVTLFNDMCILAPGALLDPTIVWEPVDDRTVRARFTNGANAISATLGFDERGLLTNFVSDDRSRASPDGTTFTRLRFSTPVSDYRSFGPFRIAAHGEARWRLPDGEFTYGEFELVDLDYNVP